MNAVLHSQLSPEFTVFAYAAQGGAVDADSILALVNAVDPAGLVYRPCESLVFMGFSSLELAKLAVRLSSKVKLNSGSPLVCVLNGGDITGGEVQEGDEAYAAKLAIRPSKPKPITEKDLMTAKERALFFRQHYGQVSPEMLAQYRKRVFEEVANLKRIAASNASQSVQQLRRNEVELAPPAAAAAERAKASSSSTGMMGSSSAQLPPRTAPAPSLPDPRFGGKEYGEVSDEEEEEKPFLGAGAPIAFDSTKRLRKLGAEAPTIFAAASAAAQAVVPPAKPTSTSPPPLDILHHQLPLVASPAPLLPTTSVSERSADDANVRFENALAAIAENRIDWSAADRVNAAEAVAPWLNAQFEKILGEADPDVVAFVQGQIKAHASKADVTHHVGEILGADAAVEFVSGLWKELKRVCASRPT